MHQSPSNTTNTKVFVASPTEQGPDPASKLPWTEKFQIRPEKFTPDGFTPEPPSSYLEALKRQQRLLHGAERRQNARLHRLVKTAVQTLVGGIGPYETAAADERAAAVVAAEVGGGLVEPRGVTHPTLSSLGLMLQRRLSSKDRGVVSDFAGSTARSSELSTPTNMLLPSQQQQQPAPSSRRRSTASRDGLAPPTSVPSIGPPSFAGAMLACLQAHGRVPDNKKGSWAALRSLGEFGLGEEGRALADGLSQLKLRVSFGHVGRYILGARQTVLLDPARLHLMETAALNNRLYTINARPTAAPMPAWRAPSRRLR
jgi:hypothetical protein